MKNIIKTWKWTRTAGALLLFFIGLSFIIAPHIVASYMALMLGLFLIAFGILTLLYEIFQKIYRISVIGLILGSAYFAIGIALVSIPTAILTSIMGVIIAILICAEGISSTAQAIYESSDNRYWPLKLIVGIITTAVGIFIIFNTSESTDILLIITGVILVYISFTQFITLLFLTGNKKMPIKKDKHVIIDAVIVEAPSEEKK